MSKKCTSCGFELEDDSAFCTNCGAKQESAPETASKGASDAAANPINSYLEKAKKNPLLLIIPASAILVFVVILVSLIVAVFAGAAYKKPLDTCNDVFYGGKGKNIEKLAPEKYWEYIEKQYNITVKDIEKFYENEEYYKYIMKPLEDDCGKNVKVRYKVEEKDELTEKELDKIKETLKSEYDISRKNVTKAYELDVEWNFKGKDDEKKEDKTVIVVKIDGKWYVYDNGTFGNMLSVLILAATVDKAADKVQDGLGSIIPGLG